MPQLFLLVVSLVSGALFWRSRNASGEISSGTPGAAPYRWEVSGGFSGKFVAAWAPPNGEMLALGWLKECRYQEGTFREFLSFRFAKQAVLRTIECERNKVAGTTDDAQDEEDGSTAAVVEDS